MNDMKRGIDELTVSLFRLHTDGDGGVSEAARQILQIYSRLFQLTALCDELAATGNSSLLNDAKQQWNTFRRGWGSLDQKFGIQKPTDLGPIESKISWKKVELLSHDLGYEVAALRSQMASFRSV